MKQICLIISVLLFCACQDIDKSGVKQVAITIDLQPFSDITQDQIDFVHQELLKIYPNVEIKEAIELPKQAYYKERNRYRADTLIGFLNKRTPLDHVTMALTSKDISWTNGNIKDFGIFGLGLCPGKACVASTFRLSKTKTKIQLFKVAIHELGHTQGLPHCPVKTCFMRDAEGKNPTDEEKEFCPKCKTHLINRGWDLE